MKNASKRKPALKGTTASKIDNMGRVSAALTKVGVSPVDTAEVNAMLGEGGHCRSLRSSDLKGRDAAAANLEAIIHTQFADALADGRVLRLEAFDDVGATPVNAPVVRSKALLDQTAKAIGKLRLSAIIFVQDRIIVGGGKKMKEASIFTNCRAIVIAPPGVDMTNLHTIFAASRDFRQAGVPANTISVITAEKLSQAARWSTGFMAGSTNVSVDKSGKTRFQAGTKRNSKALIRLIEGLSQREYSDCYTGVGSDGAKLARSIRSKLLSWHRGRVESGTMLAAETDLWARWAAFWNSYGSPDSLPFRFDVGVKPIPVPRKRSPRPKKPAAGSRVGRLRASKKRRTQEAKAEAKRGSRARTSAPAAIKLK